ncbi:MAG: GntR family transcriptional regulator [Cryobacterium sp.]|nr:GntR family transcriptional regulator [Cryobacterium sp.]
MTSRQDAEREAVVEPTGNEPEEEQASSSRFASERAADHLRQMILDDRLLPGERIRQEAVALELGASRLPVREALRILEAEGLVVLKANSGARVARMDFAECEAIYKLRERVEPLVLAESIPYLTDETVDELDRLQAGIESAPDLATFLSLDRELHLLTYSGCPIPRLVAMAHQFWNTTQHYRGAFIRLRGWPQNMEINTADHRLLLDAIRRRSVEDAEQVLAAHIRRTRKELASHPEIFEAGHSHPAWKS